ncbi:DUF4397 domain-containing protein [Mucilaginibacter sp. RS28]|uniref:DUF4397 domain-containing protein n=1 Tax=Mucilaginibacter straminoryzae TaxID=2932774 RepID=A0A9X2B974_9SPHI|nr:DUF4397 domain-containing protein [Mucilaginibacter straminoryzae]MCJ8210314.1 DUF4397 domain-containing protein [Mucilaginibacter straminoryzae]
MKNKFSFSTKYLFIALLALVAGFSSCKKDNQYDFKGTASAQVNLINASPDAGNVSLYVAGTLRTPSPVGFSAASGYYKTYIGEQSLEVKNSAGTTIASGTHQLDASVAYTGYLVGPNNALALVLAKDDGTAPSAGKARIRFVHAAPNLSNVDVAVNSTVTFSSQAYRSATGFTEVNPGSVSVRVLGSLLNLSGNYTVEAGKTYTVLVKGVSGGSGNSALSLAFIAHGQQQSVND